MAHDAVGGSFLCGQGDQSVDGLIRDSLHLLSATSVFEPLDEMVRRQHWDVRGRARMDIVRNCGEVAVVSVDAEHSDDDVIGEHRANLVCLPVRRDGEVFERLGSTFIIRDERRNDGGVML